ncbi:MULTISPECIES: hypothetical protein [Cytobacillus]|uniref:hypothetical protein n=1 Tax=Cytobacillus TaxID=2675230 RepID=UPI00203B9CE1|nr:hypothetical protein [Cytobacillus oceanisediminis]MCM3243211.1 hypothetical protein [Cytobacillus oceanisediminis]MDK7665456.1 hypothetical protein [Cytobacillus oceanisediminis]
MKKPKKILYFYAIVLVLTGMLAGCGDKTNDGAADDDLKNNSSLESAAEETAAESEANNGMDTSTEGSAHSESDSTASEKSSGDKENKATLSQYSSQQIEYARVWLQLGPNQDLDELYVQHIHAGTPLNPEDETSAGYPEDVIQLAGSRLADGSVTYSGNGDGTINVYNVPLRWDGQYPAGEKFYTDIIENTKQVSVEPGEDEKVIELIEKLMEE